MAHIKPDHHNRFLKKYSDLKSIDLLIADLNGVLRGKRIQTSALEKVFQEGLLLPASVFAGDITGATVEETGLGIAQGDSDRVCRPIPGTLSKSPWYKKSMGQVLMTMHEADGNPFFADPRQVLKRIIGQFQELGFTAVVAVELEFYLLDIRRDRQKYPQPPISPVTGKHSSLFSR